MTPRLHRSQLSLYPSDGDLGALEGGEVADWLLPWMACPEVSPDWSRTSGAAYWRVKQGVLIPSSPSRGFRRAKPKSTTFNSASSASEANNRFWKKSWDLWHFHTCTEIPQNGNTLRNGKCTNFAGKVSNQPRANFCNLCHKQSFQERYQSFLCVIPTGNQLWKSKGFSV